jgi:hypothetical protein
MIKRSGMTIKKKSDEGRPARIKSEHDRHMEMARRTSWEMVLFLTLSICAYAIRDLNLFEMATEPLRQILGYPPPAYLVSGALVVYCFSAVSLTLVAIAREQAPERNWHQLGYRSAFYLFYAFSGAIAANFYAVLLVGLGLYVLDQYHIWTYSSRACHDGGQLTDKP